MFYVFLLYYCPILFAICLFYLFLLKSLKLKERRGQWLKTAQQSKCVHNKFMHKMPIGSTGLSKLNNNHSLDIVHKWMNKLFLTRYV